MSRSKTVGGKIGKTWKTNLEDVNIGLRELPTNENSIRIENRLVAVTTYDEDDDDELNTTRSVRKLKTSVDE